LTYYSIKHNSIKNLHNQTLEKLQKSPEKYYTFFERKLRQRPLWKRCAWHSGSWIQLNWPWGPEQS